MGNSVIFNEVSLIYKNGHVEKLLKNKKSFIAAKIAKKIVDNLIDDKNIN